jgi:hypothetical protein
MNNSFSFQFDGDNELLQLNIWNVVRGIPTYEYYTQNIACKYTITNMTKLWNYTWQIEHTCDL